MIARPSPANGTEFMQILVDQARFQGAVAVFQELLRHDNLEAAQIALHVAERLAKEQQELNSAPEVGGVTERECSENRVPSGVEPL